MKKPKLLIIGHAGHGKDTVAKMLADNYDFKFSSSSMFALERIIMPAIGEDYNNVFEDCFNDRVNRRAEWFNLIAEYNKDDPAKLARELLTEMDVYCGIRSEEEFAAAVLEGLVDCVIWVDAGDRVGSEPATSMQLNKLIADFVIDTSGPLAATLREVKQVYAKICLLQAQSSLTPVIAETLKADVEVKQLLKLKEDAEAAVVVAEKEAKEAAEADAVAKKEAKEAKEAKAVAAKKTAAVKLAVAKTSRTKGTKSGQVGSKVSKPS